MIPLAPFPQRLKLAPHGLVPELVDARQGRDEPVFDGRRKALALAGFDVGEGVDEQQEPGDLFGELAAAKHAAKIIEMGKHIKEKLARERLRAAMMPARRYTATPHIQI